MEACILEIPSDNSSIPSNYKQVVLILKKEVASLSSLCSS